MRLCHVDLCAHVDRDIPHYFVCVSERMLMRDDIHMCADRITS